MEFRDIKQQIDTGKLSAVYFFFGEEDFLIDELVKRIIEKGTEPDTKDFNCDLIQGEDGDGKTIVSLASSFPMMADRRVVVVKAVQKLSPTDKKLIASYVKNPLESTSLVLTAGKVDRRQSLYSLLTKESQWVECKVLYENQAVAWIKQVIGKERISIQHEAATYLVQQVGTSLWTLYNEIQKLLTYACGKNKLDVDDVTGVVGFSREYRPWDLTDAVSQGDLVRAFTISQHLLEKGISPVALIMDLTRRVLLLMKIRAMLDRGFSQSDIVNHLHLKSFSVSNPSSQHSYTNAMVIPAEIESMPTRLSNSLALRRRSRL